MLWRMFEPVMVLVSTLSFAHPHPSSLPPPAYPVGLPPYTANDLGDQRLPLVR